MGIKGIDRLSALDRATLPPGAPYTPDPWSEKTWSLRHQRTLNDILYSYERFINTDTKSPNASRAFQAAARVRRFMVFVGDVQGAVTTWPEGTPTKRVADDIEALAMAVERIGRVHSAPRPSGYRHNICDASDGLHEIAMRYGWVREECSDGDHRPSRLVRCAANTPGAKHHPAPITINPQLRGVGCL